MDRLATGALPDDFVRCPQARGVVDLRARGEGAAIQCEMVPAVPYLWRAGLKTLVGVERMNALSV